MAVVVVTRKPSLHQQINWILPANAQFAKPLSRDKIDQRNLQRQRGPQNQHSSSTLTFVTARGADLLTHRLIRSRVFSVLDTGAEWPMSGNILRQTVHQAAKLAAAVLRVAGVTAGLAESNGSLPPGL